MRFISWLGIPLLVSIGVVLVLTVAAQAECGKASWYGRESGNRTATGAKFRPLGYSFAMRSRDFGKVYAVTYQGKTIPAVHNDYGPAPWTGRRYDLSEGLAAALGLKHRGVGVICITLIQR